MPTTISYELDIKNKSIKDSYETESKGLKFGDDTKLTDSDYTVINNADARLMSDGWFDEPEIVRNGNYLEIYPSRYVKDNRLIHTKISGLSVVADTEIYLDTSEYKNFVGERTTLGVKSTGNGRSIKSFMFRRRDDKLEIAKTFSYEVGVSTSELQFTEVPLNDDHYVIFNRQLPWPVSELKDSNIELTLYDYLKVSLDPTRFMTEKGLTEDNFFEMCDTITIEDLNIQEWYIEGTDITLKTQYFPIYKHIAVIARFENGYREITVDYYKKVDITNGTVTIDGDFIKNNTLGDFKSFNLFYGAIPLVLIEENPNALIEAQLFSDITPLSYHGIDCRDRDGAVTLPERLVSIRRDVNYESHYVDINIPRRYTDVFVEPSSPIMINGEIVKPSKSIIIKNNNGLLKLEIAAAEFLLDLVEPFEFTEPDKIQIDSNLAGDQAAIYGLFNYNNNVKRLSMMACSNANHEEYHESTAMSGWGDGPFGAGGFGRGAYTSYGTNVIYTTATDNAYTNEIQTDYSYRVIPNEDGYDIILPAWADRSTIKVTEIGLTQSRIHNGWSFIEPDIVFLDKEETHESRTYNISFEPVAYPYITEVDVDDNTISVEIIKDPSTSYNTFDGLYLLSNKTIDLRFGYYNKIGEKIYFNNDITVNQLLTREFITRVLTKEKSVLF